MKGLTAASVVVSALLAGGTAQATENGNPQYPLGVNTVAAGFLPAEGTLQLFNYSLANSAGEYKGANGENVIPDFDLSVQANVARFLYTVPVDLGYFRYTTGVVIPVVHARAKAFGHKSSDTGVGNIIVENYLGHVSKDYKLAWYFGMDTFLPTGPYDPTKATNVGANYYTFAPMASASYMPTPRLEFNASVYLEINTKNKATAYRSGTDVDFDYSANFRPFMEKLPALQVGLNGYVYKQLADDELEGQKIGNRGQALAIGPQVRYDFSRTSGIVFKYQHEFAVRNRPAGDRFWLQFTVPLAGRRAGQ
ncbi:transporter [Novosphingobium sp. KA1]|uniref:SphA family protein n=1 Tax=Novosphingobium sp. (strain KA1) TaxID=164608 RepID=UPI001A8F430F|nr:transporter [Novosphingobium sp. KA1]QSR19328.1 hypothetical protein CA833_19315 [Novosphingobium sp. KA1]